VELRLHPSLPAANTLLSLCQQRLVEPNHAGAHQ
jgi:hypothetical protein